MVCKQKTTVEILVVGLKGREHVALLNAYVPVNVAHVILPRLESL